MACPSLRWSWQTLRAAIKDAGAGMVTQGQAWWRSRFLHWSLPLLPYLASCWCASREAAGEDSWNWIPPTRRRALDCVLGSWVQPGPTPAGLRHLGTEPMAGRSFFVSLVFPPLLIPFDLLPPLPLNFPLALPLHFRWMKVYKVTQITETCYIYCCGNFSIIYC